MFEILGIGDAIVDRIISFDEKNEHMRPILDVKGSFFVATKEQHRLLHAIPPEVVYPGGSAANTLRDLSVMGMSCAFLGKVGTDDDGIIFEKSLTDWGIHPHLLTTSQEPTGYCMVIVHEDCDRTLCSNIGASGLLTFAEVDKTLLKESRAILTEGYQLQAQPNFVISVIEAAKNIGRSVYFTLSGPHCVLDCHTEICQLLKNIDILFGNEDEFKALNLPAEKLPSISVCTKGAKGVDVWVNGTLQTFPCKACQNVINTNGAGDAFAAGFLYQYHAGADIAKCVQGGHEIALRVIQSTLAYLDKPTR